MVESTREIVGWQAKENPPCVYGVPHNCARSCTTPEIQPGRIRAGTAAAKIVIKSAERLSPN